MLIFYFLLNIFQYCDILKLDFVKQILNESRFMFNKLDSIISNEKLNDLLTENKIAELIRYKTEKDDPIERSIPLYLRLLLWVPLLLLQP